MIISHRRAMLGISFLLFIISLAACSASTPSLNNQTPTESQDLAIATITPSMDTPDTQEQTPEITPIPTETTVPTQAPGHQKTQYTLTAELDYGRHHLSVTESITYTNNSTDILSELILMVEPNRYQNTFTLTDLSWGKSQAILEYTLQGNQLQFALPQPLQPTESIDLSLMYDLYLPSPEPSPNLRPIPFGYTSRQTNLVDWYPYFPPYSADKGWLANEPWFFGEHQVYDVSDYQVAIRLTDERQDLTVAASAPAVKDGEWFRYEHPSARNFAWSVSHTYDVISETVGDVTVLSYSFPFDREAGEAVLQTTVESLALYQELFGPYPRDQLSVVEADFLDGMEFDGMYFLSNGFYNSYQGLPGDYLIAIAAHETAHQWWYTAVGNDQAFEPWLDEAACTYSERLYFERYHPEALDWWWSYRVNYFEPDGFVNRSIYEPGGYQAYRDAVYLNGALFFEDLRLLIGEDSFFAFLKDYYQTYKHHLSDTEGFFEVLRNNTQVDFSALRSSYFK